MRKLKKLAAVLSAFTVLAFGGISASATTASDVVSAARAAGILETYVMQLENFLRANEFSSDQYDIMIDGLANIRGISMDVVRRYFPDAESIDEFFYSSDSSSSSSNSSSSGSQGGSNLTEEEQTIEDLAEDIMDNMTTEEMLEAIQEIIDTGKQLGLDVTAEQTGDKSFTVTVKDSEGNIKLVTPIGSLVSRTGSKDISDVKTNVAPVAAVSIAVAAAGIAGVYGLNRKNKKIGE